MKCFITSVLEPTTDLCVWSIKRQGFEPVLVQDSSTFNAKLQYIYNEADDDFLRVDADVIVNRNIKRLVEECPEDVWWWQSLSWDWWQQDTGYAGVQYIKKQCLPILKKHIGEVQHLDRPESLMYRLEEFHNPRRCFGSNIICGLHGYGQNDIGRVKLLKEKRGQMGNYDFELAEKLNAL